jgi:HAD superfamily hydrolase (TIGR01509 family)
VSIAIAPRPASRPAAVILDMDGLLLDTEPLAVRAWNDAAAALGVAFDPALAHSMIGRTWADCCALVRERCAADYPVDALLATWHEAYDAIVARDGVALKPGVHELVDWLDAQRIARAVATSTRRSRARSKLEHAGLWSRIDALVGGDEIAHGKPAPDIVLAAAAKLGVDVASCIVLEDSEPGVLAALAAGATPIMVPDMQPPSQAMIARGVLVLASLADVRAHLASLARGLVR